MNFDPVLIADRMTAMNAAGLWRDETIDVHFRRALADCPDKPAVVGYRDGQTEPVRLSYRELDRRVDLIARGLVALGVGRSDVVSFQLPNRWEFVALSLACARIGAAANPVMPIFRQHELSYMLDFAESKVFIVPAVFRKFDHAAMARELQPRLPHLKQVVVVDGDGEDSFDHVLMREDTQPISGPGIGSDDVSLLMYTSGTTGEPKGVMHTSNTLFSNLHAYIATMELSPSDIILGASPMAHLTGYGYLAMLPLILNSTTVLQEIWDAPRALEIVRDEGVTFSMASAAFVSDMCAAVEAGSPVSPQFTKFNCAGAPIPPVVVQRAWDLMGLSICSAWGMTECGAVTVTEPARALQKSGVSDGRALPGIEIRIVGADAAELPTGETGELLIRGSSLFAGYLKRPQLNGVTADGWFDTGDTAFQDSEGYIRINGRSKDIVIRGGENIPVVEIENLLYRHPSITTVAVVGYPDRRLGERVCAFVSLKPGSTLSFEEMTAYLDKQQVAKQYYPERLEIVEDLPRTPAGKLQKFKLREAAKSFGSGQ
ncbi:cyclohexanecarboxylate-CoA ligase [Aromatoleum petrolei]|uniref:Cyclohexanecarboxylate-CoA ligase n=1 Tax=Aromatoleum petrolei TaxID=76116 RepID=A0ABX1MRQ1_9RHOO|nr:cyclohexanecarboxylate-CoA ligase [Aromatoleum petrolei]NMF90662.1 cyclohexanecarboxylate-CoA ligase [Aromatoleum petrolei]QTQ38768.1 Cyclohexanecarboxylate-CoA ligase [Aromatoleum petrolei]